MRSETDAARTPWPAQAAAALHPLLIVALVALRPLIWGGDWGDAVHLTWQALVLVGCAAVLVEHACGARRTWRWGPAGIAAAVALAIALPAAIRSPLHAEGHALWGMWAMHALFAAWLAQVVEGRERLLAGALVAGLAGTAAVTLGQWTWALPAIAQRMQEAGGGQLLYEGHYADLVERALNGGAFGTFTHANALGAYLVLAMPLAIGVALRRDERGLHLAAGAIALIALGALSLTDSKGAWLAAAGTVAIAALIALRGSWRAGVMIVLALAAAATIASPRARDALAASAESRIDAWRGALALIGERPLIGHGLGGSSAHGARVMPLDAEPTRSAHSQPIEAAVAGGIGLAAAVLALAAWLARGARPGPGPTTAADAPIAARVERWAPLAPLLAVPYAQVAGLLDVGDWPGGAGVLGEMAWACALGALMSAACAAARGVAAPHAAATRLGLIALCLHLLIDDDLHHPGIVGTLAAVACLAGCQRARAAGRRTRIAATLALIAIAAVWCFAAGRARELGHARALVDGARMGQALLGAVVRDPPPIARMLAARLGRSPETPLSELVATARVQALALCRRWPRADSDLELSALARFPAGAARLPLTREAVAAHPHSAHARMLLADDLAQLGRWDEATAPLIVAVGLTPAYLPYRVMLAATLREAARRLPSRAAELDELAAEAEAQLRALEPVVHPRNRAP
ncbi:MAG TPA: O-antigen ligase family protein [Planctomycetota bacterium]|nr:O-antigen ligase family protein [Planctomycetota bacterium]